MSTPADSHFDPDDPRLTAYALGELPAAADRAHVEALLAVSPEARAELADLRALTTALTAEYEQERLAADDSSAPLPANVIRLSARRAWLRPTLAAAAVLLLSGLLAIWLTPGFHPVQVKGSHPDAKLARQAVEAPAVPKPAAKAVDFAGQLAQNGAQSLRPIAPVPPTPAPVSELLAATASPAAAPPVSLALQYPPVVDRQAALLKPRNFYYGANGGINKELSADTSKDSTVQAGRVTISGPNIPTREDTAAVPTGPMLAESQAMAPRKVIRASAVPAAAETFAAPGTPFPADAKRAEISGPSQTQLIQRGKSIPLPVEMASDLPLATGTISTTVTRSTTVVSPSGGTVFADSTDSAEPARRADHALNTATYDHLTETPFLTAKDNPLSTFSVDVDTASYSIVRRFIEGGSLPPPDAVRIEEMLNYFPYDYAPPAPGDERPFAIHLEGAACPWSPDHRLVRVGLKGREIAQDKRPPSNLVFLIDVSGSMEPPERLPLIKESLRLLVERLTDNDRVAIVVYAGNSGLVLPSTNGAHKDTILHALDRLEAGGSTNGASGIRLAYKVAQENFLPGGTNRVILATDGDFNVGTTSQGELVRLIEKEAKGGVFLTALGVGTDNLKDATMQKLADHGNGHYAYLDGIEEAKKVLVEQMSGTLVTIAKDVKIQVEFNPAAVQSYRLIAYEKRLLRKEDFNDDRVDAGEIGAGHSVTALYEVVPGGQADAGAAPAVDALKYQSSPRPEPAIDDSRPVRASPAREMLTVKIRHKAPDSDTSERSYEAAFVDHGTAADYANASPDFKFAAAVATFGLVLRDSPYKGNATLGAAIELAQEGKGTDAAGYRAGFVELARRAQTLREAAASR